MIKRAVLYARVSGDDRDKDGRNLGGQLERQIIDALDVRATLAVEDGEKIVYARCMLGNDVLSIMNSSTCGMI
jgi:hypothetical protein